MHILHNHTFAYIAHTIGKTKSLVPRLFKSLDLLINYIISKKTKLFKKHQLFITSNKPSLCNLHYHTLLKVVHTIGKQNNLLPLIFKKQYFQINYFTC